MHQEIGTDGSSQPFDEVFLDPPSGDCIHLASVLRRHTPVVVLERSMSEYCRRQTYWDLASSICNLLRGPRLDLTDEVAVPRNLVAERLVPSRPYQQDFDCSFTLLLNIPVRLHSRVLLERLSQVEVEGARH